MISKRDASRKASQVSIHDDPLWAAITMIQRPSSVGAMTAWNKPCGGSGRVSTSFQSAVALRSYLDHDRCVTDIDADLCHLRPVPAQGVEQCQSRRTATGRVDHQIGVEDFRASRAVDKANAAHARAVGRRDDPGYPRRWPQRDVRDRLGLAPQHQLDQRPRCAQHRYSEIPLRQRADIGPLELNVAREPDRDGAGSGEITA